MDANKLFDEACQEIQFKNIFENKALFIMQKEKFKNMLI